MFFAHIDMSALTIAYTQYLERMFLQSDEFVTVAEETIPDELDINLPLLEEWAHTA
jgi:hypothetical protein